MPLYSLKIQLFDSVILQSQADKLFSIDGNHRKCSSSLVREGAFAVRKMLKEDRCKCFTSGFSRSGRNFHIRVESI